MSERVTLTESLDLDAMQEFAEALNPDLGPMFGRDVARLVIQHRLMRDALKLIRDGRCECGGRFKWTGSQTRCEQCGAHQGYGYGAAVEIAKAALGG